MDLTRGISPSIPPRGSHPRDTPTRPHAHTPTRPHAHTPTRTSFEPLEPRALLAGLIPEALSSVALPIAPLGTGAISSNGDMLTCLSPAPSSSGTFSAPVTSTGSASSPSGGVLWLGSASGSGAGPAAGASSGCGNTNGLALSSQPADNSGGGSPAPAPSLGSSVLPPVFITASSAACVLISPLSADSSLIPPACEASGSRISPLVLRSDSGNGPVTTPTVWTGGDRWAQLTPVADMETTHETGSSVQSPTEMLTSLLPKQSTILDITNAAGSNPTDEQFWDAVHKVDEMTGGDSEAALGEIMSIRDRGTDNPLLACLDHYYNARMAVIDCPVPGLMLAKVLIANAGYSFMKAVAIPVPQDTDHPPSPVTWQQWMAGNYGAADGLFPNHRSK